MTVGLDAAEKTLEDLEKEVTCVVCQDLYTDPKILPCLHYYCKQCVLSLALKAGKDKPFSCPECRKNTTLPEGGVEELKSAFLINRLKSMYFKSKRAHSKQAQCEMCKSKVKVEAVCKQCNKYACKNCAHVHTVLNTVSDGHEMVPVDQLQTILPTEIEPKCPAPTKCPVHGGLLAIFCFNCNKLICHDCTVQDHKDHDAEFYNVAADNKKKELLESLTSLKEVEDSLSQALEAVHSTEHEVKVQGDSVADTIETSFKDLHAILEVRKEQLLDEARKRVKEKIENLKGQERNLSTASAGVRSVIDYTEQCVRHCSDEEVMSMHTEISRRIQDEVEEHSKPENRLEPVEEADIGIEVMCAKDLQQLCQKARITLPIDYVVMNIMPTTAEVDKEINIELIDNNKKATKSRCHLQCQVKFVPTGAVIKPEIEVKTPDRYHISYTPCVRGRHELSISAYGQPVPGSPFTTTVYMSPTQLDKPVKEWDEVTRPYRMVVNSAGEIIVAERNKDIVVLDDEGKLLRRIEQSQHKISDLTSVAVDNEDDIYFAGEGSNIIIKANKNCDILLVRDIQVKQKKGEGFRDLVMLENEVMVMEYNNDGYIMVYDRELNYVRQITCRNKTKFRYLYPDHHGNLYISDADNTIQVLSKTGDFIRSFSRYHGDALLLKSPHMVHVCGQYVYVADREHYTILIFTTEGDYVTTFNCYGDICIDQDGLMYIGDFWNKKVTCY